MRSEVTKLIDSLDMLVQVDWKDLASDVNTKLGRAQRVAYEWKNHREKHISAMNIGGGYAFGPSGEDVEEFSYKGVTVKVVLKDQDPQLIVGGERVSCSRDADTGAYIPDESPYERYGSLKELAKARIDRQWRSPK